MKPAAIASFAAVLAALSAGGVAFLAIEIGKMRDDIRSISRDPTARNVGVEAPVRNDRRGAPQARRGEPGARIEPLAANAPDVSATLEDRVARIEQRQEKMQEAARHAPPLHRFSGGHKFARSVDDLAKTLKLTQTQKDRVQNAIDRGRQQVEDILKIPDETGKSPYEQRQERRKKLMEAIKKKDTGDLLTLATPMFSYRSKPIPGRNATYGEEIDRVKKETRDEVAATLDADQQKTFEDTMIDPLLGGGGTSMSVGVFHTDDGEGPGAMIIEKGTSVIDEVTVESPGSGKETEKDDK